jgi:arogenate/prephenate dehydratase
VPSGDGTVVPDAFRYTSHRASKKHGTSLGAAQAAAGAVDPSADPSQSVDPKKGIRVAYQGMPGAYSEAAALTAYPNCEPCPCEQFENAFEATEQWTADRAVLPFENSLGGSIHRNYDLILNHRLHIVGEVYFKVRHCLLALPGQDKADITRAMSHPQALAQCDGYLTALNGGVVKEAVDDTAGAAAHIKQNGLLGVAAVASSRAAALYGMEVYDSDIQDDKSNVTRFLALAREPLPPRPNVPYKTSIAFSMKETSGSLFKALACFALRDINLTKVESRPMRWNPVTQSAEDGTSMQFSYLFYVDFSASMADENAQNALRQLQENATFLRVLGSYPADDSRL